MSDAIIFRAAVIIRFLPATRKQLSNLKGNWNRAGLASSQIKNASERTRRAWYLDADKLLLILTYWSVHGHTSIVVSDYNSISIGIGDFLKKYVKSDTVRAARLLVGVCVRVQSTRFSKSFEISHRLIRVWINDAYDSQLPREGDNQVHYR